MDDAERVVAILAHDPEGLASTYDAYGNALYSFCVTMLHDKHDAEDAVQDTFILLAERVGQLRDPSRLRPWLYAIARSACLHRLRARRRVSPAEELEDVMDESIDFADDVHARELQQLVWDAIEGINANERAALELSLRHGVEGADLTAALGLSRVNATKVLQRAKAELDRSVGALLVARAADGACASLTQIVAGWDGRLTPLMRKRLSRHIDSCATCGEQKQRKVSAGVLFAAIPLLAAPVGLRQLVIARDRTKMVSYDRALLRRSWAFDRAGFPDERGAQRRTRGAALAVALAVVLLAVAIPLHGHSSARRLTLPPFDTSVSTPAITARSSATTSPAQRSMPTGGPSISTSAGHSASIAMTPPSTTGTSSPTSPSPKAALAITPTSLKFPAASGGSQMLTLTSSGGAVTWTAKDVGGLLKLSAHSGTTKSSISVTAQPEKSQTTDRIVFSWPGGSMTVTVSWS